MTFGYKRIGKWTHVIACKHAIEHNKHKHINVHTTQLNGSNVFFFFFPPYSYRLAPF